MDAVAGESAERARVGEAAVPPHFGPRLRSDRRWDRIRWALLVCWLLATAALVVVGERETSWTQLRSQVAAGEVDAVHVVGEAPVHSRGYSVVRVHWRDGLLRYTTEVVQVHGRTSSAAGAPVELSTPVIREAPSVRLAALHPSLRVTGDQRRASHGEMFGWQVPVWLALYIGLLLAAALAVLVAGPRPWRATRWAWFWLLLPPIGVIAFLLLSGPTPGTPPPRSPQRRLRGGWAFVLSVALAAALRYDRW